MTSCPTQRPSQHPRIYPLGSKPHARHSVFQGTGISSGLPQRVVNLSSFALLMLNRNYAEVNTPCGKGDGPNPLNEHIVSIW